MARSREGYNNIVATYFGSTQQDHYVLKSGYLIAQIDRKAKVERLKTLTKNLKFCQGNRFAFGSLIFVMLVVEKEPMNRATWFSQKLQNKLVEVQHRVGKLTNTLIGPTLTIIGYYYEELFAKEQENVVGEKKKLQK
jgi:hypothetical protein